MTVRVPTPRAVVSTSLTALVAATVFVTATSRELALVAFALLLLAGWTALCHRSPHTAVVVVVCLVLFSSHLLAVAFNLGHVPASVVRLLIVMKDALGGVLLVVLSLRAHRSQVANRMLLAASPFLAYLLIRLATSASDIPLSLRLLSFRNLLVPVIAILIGVLLTPRERVRLKGPLLALISVAAGYALIEYLLPRSFLLEVIGVGRYWAEVKDQPSFLVDGLPGNFLLGATMVKRLSGSFGDPLSAGYVIGASIALLAITRGRLTRLAWPLLVLALLLSFTRAGWLIAVLLGLAALTLARRRPGLPSVVSGALVMALVVVSVPTVRSFVTESASGSDSSSRAHQAALQVVLSSRPTALGEGLASTGAAVSAGWHTRSDSRATENAYATMVGQIGLVGLVLLFAFLLSLTVRSPSWPRGSPERRLGLTLLLGLSLTGLISEQLFTFNAGWIPWLICGLLCASPNGSADDPSDGGASAIGAPSAVVV